MTFSWPIIAVGALVAVYVLWKVLKPAKAKMLSPFQQTHTVPNLMTRDRDEDQSRLRENSPGGSADDARSPFLNSSVPFNGPKSVVRASAVDPGRSWATATTIPMDNSSGAGRISTWSDRRLFQDFRGLLAESADSFPIPVPEDLPIRNDDFVFGSLTPSIAQLLPETDTRRDVQRKTLIAAGYHSRASWLNLSAIRFTLAFLALVIVGFWLIVAPPAIEPWLLGLLVTAPLFMWALPPLIVVFKASERKSDIERGLPDVLDMMNMGVSQGLTVPQSLRRISTELVSSHPALAEELRIVDQQAEIGNLPQALRNFGYRIESPEVNSFTSLLIQSETTGTSIARALSDYSDSIRSSLKERADARANAASFQLLFPVALLLMPSVFLFLLGPAIVQMSDFFNNQADGLQQDRREALQSLDQQPQLDLRRFGAPGGAFGGSQN
jgi:Flp pilus assembly protein TadB